MRLDIARLCGWTRRGQLMNEGEIADNREIDECSPEHPEHPKVPRG